MVQAPEMSASELARQARIATDKEKLVALEAWSCMTIQSATRRSRRSTKQPQMDDECISTLARTCLPFL